MGCIYSFAPFKRLFILEKLGSENVNVEIGGAVSVNYRYKGLDHFCIEL